MRIARCMRVSVRSLKSRLNNIIIDRYINCWYSINPTFYKFFTEREFDSTPDVNTFYIKIRLKNVYLPNEKETKHSRVQTHWLCIETFDNRYCVV